MNLQENLIRKSRDSSAHQTIDGRSNQIPKSTFCKYLLCPYIFGLEHWIHSHHEIRSSDPHGHGAGGGSKQKWQVPLLPDKWVDSFKSRNANTIKTYKQIKKVLNQTVKLDEGNYRKSPLFPLVSTVDSLLANHTASQNGAYK